MRIYRALTLYIGKLTVLYHMLKKIKIPLLEEFFFPEIFTGLSFENILSPISGARGVKSTPDPPSVWDGHIEEKISFWGSANLIIFKVSQINLRCWMGLTCTGKQFETSDSDLNKSLEQLYTQLLRQEYFLG